ncbi:phosphotransferase [Blastococcus haudaquaticus]|uniref:Phosphotransferase enzyme family protein n=1 Tax=Blastococcus haudaquaticus TaxID=1938745 RepID=A0A286H7T0_9ACTN|nr:phosphotransferase [Blastococcus haudaquaticus]SOE03389.1 Phosphotransferase enzyme family protein [Blastococcus haudaquaticus]
MSSGETTGIATWRDPRWRAEALEWATAELARAGLELDGEPEQPHVRTWSTAFRLPLRGGGVAWLKSVGPGSAQEPVLAGALGRWVPDRVLVPLAVEPARRLLLLPDGGRTLRDGGADPAAWAAMLQAYARLQLALVPHADAILGLGVPDTRPGRLPALVDDLLADDDAQLVGRPGGLAPEVHGRLLAGRDDVVRACAELAGGGLPATLQHDDVHGANVFASDGRHRFFDWGDASVSHPFLSLRVALRMAGRALDLPDGGPALVRLRDAYLEPWSDYGDPRALRQQCDLALRVAPLARALTWRRILRGVHADERAEWADSVPGWTAEYLQPGPLSAVSA